jgi:hypothetical protein
LVLFGYSCTHPAQAHLEIFSLDLSGYPLVAGEIPLVLLSFTIYSGYPLVAVVTRLTSPPGRLDASSCETPYIAPNALVLPSEGQTHPPVLRLLQSLPVSPLPPRHDRVRCCSSSGEVGLAGTFSWQHGLSLHFLLGVGFAAVPASLYHYLPHFLSLYFPPVGVVLQCKTLHGDGYLSAFPSFIPWIYSSSGKPRVS